MATLPLERSERITGERRATVAVQFVERYKTGESIRAIAGATGRSYGFVHRILTENKVALRTRGGYRPRRGGGN